VVVVEAVFDRDDALDRHPLDRLRIVIGAHLGQLAVAQVEVVRVRDCVFQRSWTPISV
jgi:hypothetical protein